MPAVRQRSLEAFPPYRELLAPLKVQEIHSALPDEIPLPFQYKFLQVPRPLQRAVRLNPPLLVAQRLLRILRVSRRAPRLSDRGHASVGGAWFPAAGRPSPCETFALLVRTRLGSAAPSVRYGTAANSVPCYALATSSLCSLL